jgi:hypothetical protein
MQSFVSLGSSLPLPSLSVSTPSTERFKRCRRLKSARHRLVSIPCIASRPSARASFCAFSIFWDCDVAFPGPISSFFRTRRQASPASLLSTGFPFTSLLSKFHSGESPVEPKRRKPTDGLSVSMSWTPVLIGFSTRADLTDGTEYSAGRTTRACFSADYIF